MTTITHQIGREAIDVAAKRARTLVRSTEEILRENRSIPVQELVEKMGDAIQAAVAFSDIPMTRAAACTP